MKEDFINIYTDGACKGNPGPGGWGVVLEYKDHVKELSGSCPGVTNNQMELMAAIKGIEAIKRDIPINLYTDSQYLKKGMTEWIFAWKQNGWRNSQKKPIKNQDLWQILDGLGEKHTINWHWVKAHAGHPQNERADSLASEAAETLQKKL